MRGVVDYRAIVYTSKVAGLWEVPPPLFRMRDDSRQERREVASELCSFLQSYNPAFLTEAIRPVLLPKMSPTPASQAFLSPRLSLE